jgi:transposase
MLREPAESATLWLVLGKRAEARLAEPMTERNDTLPNDIDALRALILAERAAHAAVVAERDTIAAERDQIARRNARLEAILSEIRRAHFGRRSERITDDQLALALDDLETSLAKTESEEEKADPALRSERTRKRRATRSEILDHLPHEELVIEPEGGAVCPCCGGALHVIGEDMSKRLDKVPATVRVIVTRRPKYACRSCEKHGSDVIAGIIQAPAPPRLIEGGLPTEALVADVVVSKHADHLPLDRRRKSSRGTASRSNDRHWSSGWAMIASLLETCKLNDVDPLAWTTDVLTKLVNRWPASRIDELMPRAYVKPT